MTEVLDVMTLTLNPAVDWTLEVSDLTVGQVNRVGCQSRNPGGKGINVAARLAAAGHVTAATGLLGEANDALFRDLFATHRIADHCVRVAGETRTNVKVVDPQSQTVTDLNQPGLPPSNAAMQALEQVLFEGPVPAWYVLSGSLPPGLDDRVYADWIPRLQARGARVAVDASGVALSAAVAARPDLIKPNHHELAELTGQPTDTPDQCLQQARELVRSGIARVVVSMGADGALLVTADTAVRVVPGPVQLRTTVGAGDAMVAGVLKGLLDGGSLAEAGRLGTAFAMCALEQIGLAVPDAAALARYRAGIGVQTLAADRLSPTIHQQQKPA
ncbi:1-phosphofructokinase [Natronospirillum operosum]|uniref:Phosphofructokinase n=1 Tax=Natronospirillum operosum TaxID=2759953 RepID=A0A4Z0WB55_9GAMM|nr:1-phosphofructokinase [Natronospirillum operosum]TGG91306.1 1-phosphofructokinase [Natronospirillum operosum]